MTASACFAIVVVQSSPDDDVARERARVGVTLLGVDYPEGTRFPTLKVETRSTHSAVLELLTREGYRVETLPWAGLLELVVATGRESKVLRSKLRGRAPLTLTPVEQRRLAALGKAIHRSSAARAVLGKSDWSPRLASALASPPLVALKLDDDDFMACLQLVNTLRIPLRARLREFERAAVQGPELQLARRLVCGARPKDIERHALAALARGSAESPVRLAYAHAAWVHWGAQLPPGVRARVLRAVVDQFVAVFREQQPRRFRPTRDESNLLTEGSGRYSGRWLDAWHETLPHCKDEGGIELRRLVVRALRDAGFPAEARRAASTIW